MLAYSLSLRNKFVTDVPTNIKMPVSLLSCLSETWTWWTLPLTLLVSAIIPINTHLITDDYLWMEFWVSLKHGTCWQEFSATNILGAAQTKCQCDALSDHLPYCSKLAQMIFPTCQQLHKKWIFYFQGKVPSISLHFCLFRSLVAIWTSSTHFKLLLNWKNTPELMFMKLSVLQKLTF